MVLRNFGVIVALALFLGFFHAILQQIMLPFKEGLFM